MKRTEVAAAPFRGGIAVVGGMLASGMPTKEVDLYLPATDSWTALLDLASGRWSSVPGPRPREHLVVTSAGGKVYAVAGRLDGLDTNQRALEAYSPAMRRWTALPPVPGARGGTGAAVAGGLLLSVGGEEPEGTIGSVYGYEVASRRWRRLSDLPTPRHGLGVAALGGRIYAIGGGTEPGLSVSGANESLRLP